jgi:hypothetical protein
MTLSFGEGFAAVADLKRVLRRCPPETSEVNMAKENIAVNR